MNCDHCGVAIKRFIDARLVMMNRKRVVMCADVDACAVRKAERDRQSARAKEAGAK